MKKALSTQLSMPQPRHVRHRACKRAQAEKYAPALYKSLFALSEAYPKLRAIETFPDRTRLSLPLLRTTSKTHAVMTTPFAIQYGTIHRSPPTFSLGILGYKQRESSRSGWPPIARYPRSASAPQQPEHGGWCPSILGSSLETSPAMSP